MKCRNCFKGEVRPLAVPGRVTRYKSLARLPVPAGLEIHTCDQCGEEWMTPADAKRIDAALEPVYRAEMLKRAQTLLDRLPNSPQVERDLGLSPGYLARIRAGRKVPSAELLAFLAVIVKRPVVLKDVEAFWSSDAA